MKASSSTVEARRLASSTAWLALVTHISLSFALPAAANERSLASFEYSLKSHDASASNECPGEDTIKDAVSERLGYVPWRTEAPVHIQTTLSVHRDIIRAAIVLSDSDGNVIGERNIESRESCKEVAKAVELALAIAIDPMSLNRAPAPQAEAEPVSEKEPDPNDAPVPAACSDTSSRKNPLTAISVDVGGTGAWRTAPSITGGARAGVKARFDLASLGLAFRFDFPSSLELDPGELSAHQLLAELAPCVHVSFAAVCAWVAGGVLRTDVSGLLEQRRATLPSLSAGARIGAEVLIKDVALIGVFMDFAAALIRNALVETGLDHVFWKTPPFGIAWGLTVGRVFLTE